MTGPAWFVARTKTGREVTASVSVAAEGFDVFLPVELVQRTHARKVVQVSRPLYPRYLFVRFDPEAGTHGKINSCRGIASRGLMVSISDRPVPIPDRIMDGIRDRERVMRAEAGEIRTGYKPGETFQVQRGHALVTAHYMGEECGKVMVIVEMMGKGHIQTLDFAEVPPRDLLIDSRAA